VTTTPPLLDTDQDLAGIRTAGRLLAAAGVAFLAVVIYLYAVLLPLGLSFTFFDDVAGRLQWLQTHAGLYLAMYLIYLLQQLLLLAVPLLLWRHGRVLLGERASGLATVAAAAGMMSVPLALLSIAELIMSTHTSLQYWAVGAGDPVQRAGILLTTDATADLAKGARLVSEVLLGGWLLWLGAVLARSGHRPTATAVGADGRRGAGSRIHQGWWIVAAIGVWTVIVGVWKLLDPAMEPEDWVAFLIGGAQLAAGIRLMRFSGR
jgi:hypothetical protein